jgi:rhodanese-related sulfurtransferase
LIVAEDDSRVREATTRLARVGLENVRGYLAGGLLDWHDAGLPLATTEQIPVDELYQRLREPGAPLVVDVRRPAEWEAGHIPGAVHLPLTQLAATCTLLEHGRRYAIVCASGYRSSIAASLLEQCGYDGVTNVVGGMTAWTAAKLPVERSSSESS